MLRRFRLVVLVLIVEIAMIVMFVLLTPVILQLVLILQSVFQMETVVQVKDVQVTLIVLVKSIGKLELFHGGALMLMQGMMSEATMEQ